MSDGKNLDLIRRWFDAWNSADMETFAQAFDSDAELVPDPSWMEVGPFRGREAIMGWFQGLPGSWEAQEVVLTELFELGDKVIARLDWEVRGRASGIEMKLDATSVNTIRNAQIVRQQYYFDHAEALKAVGLG